MHTHTPFRPLSKPLLTAAALLLFSIPAHADGVAENCAIVYSEAAEANESRDPFYAVATAPIQRSMMRQRLLQMLEILEMSEQEFDEEILTWFPPAKATLHNAKLIAECDATYGMEPAFAWHPGFGSTLAEPEKEAWVHALTGKHPDGYDLHAFIDAASVFQLRNGHWIYRYGTDHSANPNGAVSVIEYYELNCDNQTQRAIYRQTVANDRRTLSTDWYSSNLNAIQANTAGAAVSRLICGNSWSADHPRALADNFFDAAARVKAAQ